MASIETYLNVYSDRIVQYKQYSGYSHIEDTHLKNLEKGRKKYESNTISYAARKRLLKAVDQWSVAALERNRKVNSGLKPTGKKVFIFVTLTLPVRQSHSDYRVKRICLGEFLRSIRSMYGVKHYVWRAETQRNGNIHFHLIIDRYIPKFRLQRLWNDSIEKLKYVTEYSRWSKKKNPPTTNIQQVNNIRSISSYLGKYLGKQDPGARPIEGKVWDCSESLKTVAATGLLLRYTENGKDYTVPDVHDMIRILSASGMIEKVVTVESYAIVYCLKDHIISINEKLKIPILSEIAAYYESHFYNEN